MNITIGTLSMEAELNETPTARKVAEALPIRATFNTWGDEIYFSIPVDAELADSAVNIIGRVLGDAAQFKGVMREREVEIASRAGS